LIFGFGSRDQESNLSYVPNESGAKMIAKKAIVKKIPRHISGGFHLVSVAELSSAQQQDQDDQRDRNSNQPEQNGHVSFPFG
jgi:hypothetical protein